MKSEKYDNVLNYFGESVEHYAKKNPQTYFAEAGFQIDAFSMKPSLNPIALNDQSENGWISI